MMRRVHHAQPQDSLLVAPSQGGMGTAMGSFSDTVDIGIVQPFTKGTSVVFSRVPQSTTTFVEPPSAPTTTSAPPAPMVTVTSTESPTTTSTDNPSAASENHGLSVPLKMTVIIVPILLVLAIIPIIYLICLRRRLKRQQQGVPELKIPQQTSLLRSGSRHNSVSLPSPYSDTQRFRSGTLSMFERPPSQEIYRAPSPTLPSPSVPMFRTQEAWPLTSALPDIPIAYSPQSAQPRPDSTTLRPDSTTLRPDSSAYTGTPQTSGFPEATLLSTQPQGPPTNRESDAISELSYNPQIGIGRRRSERSPDELSIVSALSPDDHEDRNFGRMV